MNISSESSRCPKCSAEIPVGAPQGLCPKCLLMQVALSMGEIVDAESQRNVESPQVPQRQPVTGQPIAVNTRTDRPAPPSIAELASAFPQLEILELIGRGGMGFVYKARQLKLDRLVAIKILPGHLATEPSFHERFEREARVLAKLQHPLIVSVYDFGEARITANGDASNSRSFFYLMLEYVDGVNLREAMRAGKFTPEQALAIVPQVCEALQYAHSKGVLHRDIKPENILLDVDGRVKIADFGIAKALEPAFDQSSQASAGQASESEIAVTRLTATGSILGTPLYMAPEQLISPNAVDHRADIYSLGVVFYEMLTGELPMGRFAPPSEKSLVDQRIDDIVLRALAKERELRQQSAVEMKTEVETAVSDSRKSPAVPNLFAVDDETHRSALTRSAMARKNAAIQTGGLSGMSGWWALIALILGIPLSLMPMIGFRVSTLVPNEPTVVGFLVMFQMISAGLFGPIWFGWRHLLRQRHQNRRAGIIPAMIAAWFLMLTIMDIAIFVSININIGQLHFQTPEHHETVFVIANCLAALACVVIDGAILVATWHWATRTPYQWRRGSSLTATSHTDDPGRRRWGMAFVVGSILFLASWGMYVSHKSQRALAESQRRAVERIEQLATTHHELLRTTEELTRLEGIPPNRANVGSAQIAMNLNQLRDRFFRLKTRISELSVPQPAQYEITFLPIALFAAPFALTGAILLMWPHMLMTSIGTLAVSLTMVFIANVLIRPPQPESPGLTPMIKMTSPAEESPISNSSRQPSPQMSSALTRTKGSAPKATRLPPYDLKLKDPDFVVGRDEESNPLNGLRPDATKSNRPQNSPAAKSEAVVEADRLNLVLAADEVTGLMLAPAFITGDHGQVSVERHCSALVRLPEPSKRLTYGVRIGGIVRTRELIGVRCPCDYLALDWSEGGSPPRLLGYMLSPGAYEFHGDLDSIKDDLECSGEIRAEIGTRSLKLIADAPRFPASESEWQQATKGPHLRFKLVPNSVSKRNDPEGCLIVLTEGSRTLFTRTGTDFTQHGLTSEQPIRRFREFLGTIESNLKAQAKENAQALLDRADRAVRNWDWEELLSCMSDDCRDEWMFEIVAAIESAKKRSTSEDEVLKKWLNAAKELVRHAEDEDQVQREKMERIQNRFQNYHSIPTAERRQLRIDILRNQYSDMRLFAITTLKFQQQLSKANIIDLSIATDLRVDANEATATWTKRDGTDHPIRLCRQNARSPWVIQSLVGKSIYDSPKAPVPDDVPTSPPATASEGAADATKPENLPTNPKENE